MEWHRCMRGSIHLTLSIYKSFLTELTSRSEMYPTRLMLIDRSVSQPTFPVIQRFITKLAANEVEACTSVGCDIK